MKDHIALSKEHSVSALKSYVFVRPLPRADSTTLKGQPLVISAVHFLILIFNYKGNSTTASEWKRTSSAEIL